MTGEGADAGAARHPECERLAAELRAMRERTGLSLAGLAERTPYSKSSWQRYLGGRGAIPRDAVASLCSLAGEPPGRLLALWELADAVWSGRARAAGGPAPRPRPRDAAPPAPPVAPARPRRRRPAVLTAAVVLAAGLAVALWLALTPGSGAGGGAGTATGAALPDTDTITAGCEGASCEGRNPMVMGCGPQGMIETLGTYHGPQGQRLEVRYGRACHTVWIRATGLRLGDRVRLAVPGGPSPEVAAHTRADTERYLATPMSAADPDTTRACLYHPGVKKPTCWHGDSTER
ncbi:helix-turn-helix domain-containing protein [Streptomyces sp. NPDC050560]|uniref:helix-turn-helix domain-containing protein n=1 Tax=Streptomyces sp. NPDC050560 TaxID=3365630 RepID=UPI0037978C1F